MNKLQAKSLKRAFHKLAEKSAPPIDREEVAKYGRVIAKELARRASNEEVRRTPSKEDEVARIVRNLQRATA